MTYFLLSVIISLTWITAGLVTYCAMILDAKRMLPPAEVTKLISNTTIYRMLLKWPLVIAIWLFLPEDE